VSSLDLADGMRLLHAAGSEGRFGHPEPLAFAWMLLDQAENVDEAIRVALRTIRHVAEAAGNPGKFHATVTVFWLRLVDHIRHVNAGLGSIQDAILNFPDLADPDLPGRYFSSLDSDAARKGWIEPDLEPMP